MFGKVLSLLILSLTVATLRSTTITFAEASDHIGQEVTVAGHVSRVSTIPSGLTFINFGKQGDGATFTAVARAGTGDAAVFKGFEGKEVEVTGVIELYKDKPQIVLKTAEDLQLAGNSTTPEEPGMGKKADNSTSQIRTFEIALNKDELKLAGETEDGISPDKAEVAISIPEDFDPTRPHPVIAVFPDFFTNQEIEKLISPYTKVANSRGWVVIAAKGQILTNDLPAGWHTAMFLAAIRQLSTEYAGIKDWPYYLAGNADGATRASLSSGAFIAEDLELRGLFLSSLKRQDFEKSIEIFAPSKLKMKKLKVFVSLGKEDSMVSEEDSLKSTEEIRKAGLKQLRHEIHEGRTGADDVSLEKAIDWFEEAK